MEVGEALVVDAHEFENGGMKVVDVDGVFDDAGAVIVSLAVGDSRFGSASGHPHREASWMMIATVVFLGEFAL